MKSKNYKAWFSVVDIWRCISCKERHGQIYEIHDIPNPSPPLHEKCRCYIQPLDAKRAGTATINGINGADWWLVHFSVLPQYYLTEAQAESIGWVRHLGNLHRVAPEKMLTKGIYRNHNGHLPTVPGRIWYEADINYTRGWRGNDRIVWSNDGLIFVTYDHYRTFVEITP